MHAPSPLKELRDLKTFLLFGTKVLKSQRVRTVSPDETSPQFSLSQRFLEEISHLIDSLPQESEALDFFEEEICQLTRLRQEVTATLQGGSSQSSEAGFESLQCLLDQIRQKIPKKS